jgi:uncharacterized protein YndB with AHSA1/START domain
MIVKEIVLPAPREEVWEALTDPDRLADWFANTVELDLRPGGGAHFRWGNGEERHATFTEIDPERRLAFDWDDDGTVEFTLDDDADGTRLTVVETTPAWSTALELQASAFAIV